MREAARKHFSELRSVARKNTGARIVIMFKGEKQLDVKRLTLHDIESSWIDLQQQILKAL